jgi:hypothetical protein
MAHLFSNPINIFQKQSLLNKKAIQKMIDRKVSLEEKNEAIEAIAVNTVHADIKVLVVTWVQLAQPVRREI